MTAPREYKLPSLSFLLVKDYPKAWQEFWEPVYSLCRKHQVNVNSALEVFRLVYECVSREEEGKPVSTGFLVGESGRLRAELPDSAGVIIERENILDAARKIRSLFGIVDGYTSVFIIGKDGVLEDVRLMPSTEGGNDGCTSAELHGYRDVLSGDLGYGLVALGSFKTAKLFSAEGLHSEVYFSGKAGEWAYRSISDSISKLDRTAAEKRIDRRVVRRVFSIVISMSNYRTGGTIVIGNPEEIIEQSETPRFRLEGINVLDLVGPRERYLFNLSTQEFALLVNRQGELKASSVRLMARVSDKARVELTSTDGGRHRSAAEISASTDSVAFVVSDDGPITVYSGGKRTLRI